MSERYSGVLMHISSLPSPFAIGVLGCETRRFIDKLAKMKFHYLQVLPLGPVDFGNSPYAGNSAFAGNYLFIDPRGLEEERLVRKEDVDRCVYPGSPYTTDYAFAEKSILTLLRTAYQSFLRAGREQELDEYVKTHKWADTYSIYMALKQMHSGAPWWEWGYYIRLTYAREHYSLLRDEARFWVFVMSVFSRQWNAIHDYAEKKGVKIIGDIPVYVARDSCDVWAHKSLFMLDEKTSLPTTQAGVPPDYFCADGQLWGNPLYNWDELCRRGFDWWIGRIENALTLYDVVRIDHFRGLASYWSVPEGAKNARNGKWEKALGKEMFETLFKKDGALPIIAEDLGVFGDDVEALLRFTGFPGMRVIQFGFSDGNDPDCTHLIHNFPENCVAYSGTHDNNTLLGWLWDAGEAERKFALDYCGFSGDNWGEGGYRSPAIRCITESLMRSQAKTVILAFQDICGFGKDARMNIPGEPKNNWRFRTTQDTIDGIDEEYYAKINHMFGRDNSFPEKKVKQNASKSREIQ